MVAMGGAKVPGRSLSATAMQAGKGNAAERKTHALEFVAEHTVLVKRGIQEACASASEAGAAGDVKCKMSAMGNCAAVMENVTQRGGKMDNWFPSVIVMKASWESTARKRHLVMGSSIQKRRL